MCPHGPEKITKLNSWNSRSSAMMPIEEHRHTSLSFPQIFSFYSSNTYPNYNSIHPFQVQFRQQTEKTGPRELTKEKLWKKLRQLLHLVVGKTFWWRQKSMRGAIAGRTFLYWFRAKLLHILDISTQMRLRVKVLAKIFGFKKCRFGPG